MASVARPQGPAGGLKPRPRGPSAWRTPQTFRRLVQLAFAGFVAYTTILHVVVGEGGAQITASPEAYCPFGGMETLYRFVTTGGRFVPHTHLSNVVLFAAVMLTAFLARSAFCGWICPLGFLQDMVTGLSEFVQKRVPGVRRAVRTLKKRGAGLAVLDRPLRLVKYGVLIWAVTGAAIYGVMVFRDYDPWAALLTIFELSVGPGLVVLGITLVASLFIERSWCRYACPLGAISGLAGWLSPVYLKREESACTACGVCTRACPMGLPVHTATTIKSPDCIGCLECTGVCPRAGALELKVGLPVVGS